MPYRELPAPGRPAPHVACLWMRDPEPAAHAHRIVPDGCADVVWVQGQRLAVAGPQTEAVVAEIPAAAAALGICFRIGAAGSALRVPARELLDRTVALEDVWGPGARGLAERLDAAATPGRRAGGGRCARSRRGSTGASRRPTRSTRSSARRRSAPRARAPRSRR